MKQKILIIALTITSLVLLSVIIIPKINLFIKIDSCLDHGGRWNYECDTCETSNNTTNTVNTPEIKIIQVFFYHSFLYPSVISYNVKDSTILFQHNGISLFMSIPPEKPNEEEWLEVVEMFVPKSIYFKINPVSQTYLKDSVISKLTAEDFQDSTNYHVDDGGGFLLVFAYDNDSTETVELVNYNTINQYNLVIKLLEECVKQRTDSLTNAYLNTLQRYTE